nr:MAG TPA: Putative bacterial sensory transduction regulator [Caudoviricetes sp.]
MFSKEKHLTPKLEDAMSDTWSQVIKSLLEANDFRFSQFNDSHGYTLAFAGEFTPLNLLVFATECSSKEETSLSIIGKLPYRIPEDEVPNMLHFLNEKNCELVIGNFELHESKKISYRMGTEIWPDFNAEKLKSLIYLSVTCLDDLDIEIREAAKQTPPRFSISF